MFNRKAHIEVIVYKGSNILLNSIEKAIVVLTRYGKVSTFVYCSKYPTIQDLWSEVPEVKEAVIYNKLSVMASDILDFLTLDGVSNVTTNSVVNLSRVLERDIGTDVVFKFNVGTEDFCDDVGFEVFTIQDIRFTEREGRDYYRPENIKLVDALKLVYAREEFVKESRIYRLMIVGIMILVPIASFIEGVFICKHI